MKNNTIFSRTNIEGVRLHELTQIGDERGTVLHMLRKDDPGFNNFGEVYFSEVTPGAIKAWKLHHQQTQNIAVPIGRVRLVVFDDREKSPTRGEVNILELGRPAAYYLLTIPPNVWYGFACIGDSTALLANCVDLPHDPEESVRKPKDDPAFPYTWE